MANKTKTIEYAFTTITGITDNVLTSHDPLTIYIPESSGTLTFKSVIVETSIMECATAATGNYTTRRIDLSLGGKVAVTHTNSNVYTGSGENTCIFHALNATTHFTTNWTGTTASRVIYLSILIDGTAATIAWGNIDSHIYISYEYDDTQPAQIKTVYIPLNYPVIALATAKPAAIATIPALDTELPESDKIYRQFFITVQGNYSNTNNTTDSTVTVQIDAHTAYTIRAMESGIASDYWYRFLWDYTALNIATTGTTSFYIWSNVARYNHGQSWLTVTYEFSATGTTGIFVSTILPMELDSPMGGNTSADFQNGSRDLWIQEPGTITTKQIAYYVFWDQNAASAGLNMRIGTGSFVTYTDIAAVLGGSNGAMVRNDAAFSLSRGKNSFNFDCYRTSTTVLGWNVCGFWIINYTASKPLQGYGSANKTIKFNLGATYDGAAITDRRLTATSLAFASPNYFINAVGNHLKYTTNGTTSNVAALTINIERLTTESGGHGWLNAYTDISSSDAESGIHHVFSQTRGIFRRWSGDTVDTSRLDLNINRRWGIYFGQTVASTCFTYLDLIYSTHSIVYTISGNTTGSAGGTITLSLYRTMDGVKVLTQTVVGNTIYSFTWFDNTSTMFVTAYEDSTHQGVSKTSIAEGTFDIALSASVAASETSWVF